MLLLDISNDFQDILNGKPCYSNQIPHVVEMSIILKFMIFLCTFLTTENFHGSICCTVRPLIDGKGEDQ